MIWQTVTLGELVELQRGYDLPETRRRPGTVPVCGSAGINGYHDTAKAPGPGVTVGRSGASIGVVTFVNEPYWPHNTVLFVKDFKGNDPRFVAAVLQQTRLAELNSGSAQPSLNRNFVYHLPIKRPSLDVQRRIAGILSSYDDLIDLNTRRIAILEEIARRLYDEWLAEAETNETKAVSLTVGQIVTASLGGDWGTDQPDDDQSERVRIIRGTDIPDLTTGNFERCPTRYISSKSLGRRILMSGDIIVENSINARSRPAGTALLVTPLTLNALGGRAIAASFCRVFKTTSKLDAAFLLAEMRHLHRTRNIEKYQVVAANGIANFQSTRFLERHTIKIPRNDAQRERLGRLLGDLYSSVFSVVIENLSTTRQFLLPKLISGEIDLTNAERQLAPSDQVAAE
jgi:type I restriction enzyme S subunit